MTDETSQEGRRLSRFSNADRGAYGKALQKGEGDVSHHLHEREDVPLADLIEHVIRDGVFDPPGHAEQPTHAEHPPALPSKLIEELKAAQDKRHEPGNRFEQEGGGASQGQELTGFTAEGAPAKPKSRGLIGQIGRLLYRMASGGFRAVGGPDRIQKAKSTLVNGAKRGLHSTAALSRRMRFRDWRRRYLALISIGHRHLFDRRTEKLLFSKTPALQVYNVTDTARGLQKTFVYTGPVSSKVLNWALSAVPSDLKRYAFVDFRAGNGRTLLLAARRNFEYAVGYAFDTESCELLEMNLAQYPRSYMSCRDVRALRGDREGIAIPSQPAVLYFPVSLSQGHLEIILNNVSTSYRQSPRPLYLVFESGGRQSSLHCKDILEKVPLPIVNRMKAILFSPAQVAVYRTLNTAVED